MTPQIAAILVTAAILTAGGLAAADAHASSGTGAELTDLQAMIDAAGPGDLIQLSPGTYRGGVVIDKPLTLRGDGSAVIDGGGEGVVVEVRATDVTLEGLVIRGSGDQLDREHAGISGHDSAGIQIIDNRFEDVLFGMFLRNSHGARVVGNVIGGKDLFIARRGDGIRIWESRDVLVESNTIMDGRDTVFWFCNDITVHSNQVSGGRYGLHFTYSDGALVEGNVARDNSVGAFLMYSTDVEVRRNIFDANRGPSGYGLGLKDMDGLVIEGNRFVGNRSGLFLDNSPSRVDQVHEIRANVIAFNDVGVLLRPSVKNNVFWGNAFIDNTEQVAIDGRGRLAGNEWAVEGRGNYWSDFAGYDADRDGVGDIPYEIDDLFSSLSDEHPELRLFNGTPAARAVDMAGRAFPSLRPEPKITDPAPLTGIPDLPPLPEGAEAAPSRLGLLAVSAMMLAFAALIILPSGRAK